MEGRAAPCCWLEKWKLEPLWGSGSAAWLEGPRTFSAGPVATPRSQLDATNLSLVSDETGEAQFIEVCMDDPRRSPAALANPRSVTLLLGDCTGRALVFSDCMKL